MGREEPGKAKRSKSRPEPDKAEAAMRTTNLINDDASEPSGLTDLLMMSDDALDTEDEEKDPTF